MSVSDKIKENRKNKSKELKELGIDPYPIEVKRTCEISKALENFDSISEKEKEITLVGRMRTMRTHGGLTFIDFEDGTGKIQGLITKDKVGPSFYDFFLEMFDIGEIGRASCRERV